MCYSVLYFIPSTEKNDSLVVLKSLNPEGPLGNYLCDVTLPIAFDHVSVSFLWNKESEQDFLSGEKNLIILSFLWSIFLFPVFLCSFIIPYYIDFQFLVIWDRLFTS